MSMDDGVFYVELLKRELEKRKEKNSRYSLRAFAQHLEIHPSSLSRVLNGTQDLSLKAALLVLNKIQMQEEEKQKFLESVALERQTRAGQSQSGDGIDQQPDGMTPFSMLQEMIMRAHRLQQLVDDSEIKTSKFVETAEKILKGGPFHELAHTWLSQLVDVAGADGCSLHLPSRDGLALEPIKTPSEKTSAIHDRKLLLSQDYPASVAFRTGESVWNSKVDEIAKAGADGEASSSSQKWYSLIPLKIGELTAGVLGLRFSEKKEFLERERRFLLAFAQLGVLVLERAKV